jgi:hypothetical protein
MPSANNHPDDHASWKRCNDMILSWILNSITPELADNVKYSTTAQEVWEDLRDHFSQSNAPRIFQIKRDIACVSQAQMIVASYYTKLKGLWDELRSYSRTVCSYGADHKRRQLMQFLMGLNESYKAIRGQILLLNPLRDVRQTYCNSPAFQAQNNSNFFLYLTHIVLEIGEPVPSHHQDTIHTLTTINISFKSDSYINI